MIRPRLRHPLSLPPHNARLIVDFERSGQYVKGTEVPEKIFKGRGLFKRVLFLLHRDLSRSRAKAHANFASDFFFFGNGRRARGESAEFFVARLFDCHRSI